MFAIGLLLAQIIGLLILIAIDPAHIRETERARIHSTGCLEPDNCPDNDTGMPCNNCYR